MHALYDSEPMALGSVTPSGATAPVSVVLLGGSTVSSGNTVNTVASRSPLASCLPISSGGQYRYDRGSGGCLHAQTGGAISSGTAQTINGVTVTTNQSRASNMARSYSITTGLDNRNRRGWYYDIPEVDNSNAAKVLANPMMWSANTMMFYSQSVSVTGVNNTTAFCNIPVLTVNLFNVFSGNSPGNEIDIGSVSSGNRIQISGMTAGVVNGTDSLAGVGGAGGAGTRGRGEFSLITQRVNAQGLCSGWRINR